MRGGGNSGTAECPSCGKEIVQDLRESRWPTRSVGTMYQRRKSCAHNSGGLLRVLVLVVTDP